MTHVTFAQREAAIIEHQMAPWLVGLAVAVSTVALVTGIGVMWVAVQRAFDTDPAPVAAEWTIRPAAEQITWGVGPGIDLEGEFICGSAVRPDTPLQFAASVLFIEADTNRITSVPARLGPAVAANLVCGGETARFRLPWSSLPVGAAPTLPSVAAVRYSVTADGYATSAAQTVPFIIDAP